MHDVVLIIGGFVSAFYAVLMLFLTIGVQRLKLHTSETSAPLTSFSVIVPFRNEAENLEALLNSFRTIAYPRNNFEILMVDDASTDASVEFIERFKQQNPEISLQLIYQKKASVSPKKEAIEKALTISKFEWIITTDADCRVPRNWLTEFHTLLQVTACDMVVAPVLFSTNHSLLEDFQQLDFLSLMAATQGGFGIGYPFLCNGANLCYRKRVFKEVKGFEGNSTIASGDDIFLMEKFLKHNPAGVKYLKSREAVVITQPQKSISDFIHQRIRWAAKATGYKNKRGQLVGLVVLSMNLFLFLSVFLWLFDRMPSGFFLLFWMLKLVVDFMLLAKVNKFFQLQYPITKYLIFGIIYPFYAVFIGLFSFRKGFMWKGRRYLR